MYVCLLKELKVLFKTKQRRLPCAFAFEKGWVLIDQSTIKFKGYYKECKNKIVGEGSPETREFLITTKNSSSIRHFGGRSLAGPVRIDTKRKNSCIINLLNINKKKHQK